MNKRLTGKVILVTGGSRGIGRAIAVRAAEEGARVFINYTANPQAAEESVGLCRAQGVDAEALGFDVSNSAAVDEAVADIHQRAGRLDILVNNAGMSKDGLFMRMKDEDWRRTIAVNLDGAFFCARAAGKIMMKARTGRIINMSSIVGEMGNAGQAPYVSAKAGMIGLTKSLAKELAPRNVTVNAITPGFIETDMTSGLDDKVRAQYQEGIPLGRFGRAEEVAALVAFLASDEAAYITGQVLGINGGLYM